MEPYFATRQQTHVLDATGQVMCARYGLFYRASDWLTAPHTTIDSNDKARAGGRLLLVYCTRVYTQ